MSGFAVGQRGTVPVDVGVDIRAAGPAEAVVVQAGLRERGEGDRRTAHGPDAGDRNTENEPHVQGDTGHVALGGNIPERGRGQGVPDRVPGQSAGGQGHRAQTLAAPPFVPHGHGQVPRFHGLVLRGTDGRRFGTLFFFSNIF